jgi:Domain of unknown function (DUF4386)
MHPTVKAARIAGAIYLLMVVSGPFSLMYVPAKLIVKGNATATAGNVMAHETMFRLAILGNMLGSVIFVCLAVALYRLFREVDRTQSLLLVGLVLVSSAAGVMNEVNNLGALILFQGGDFLSVFNRDQLNAAGMLFVRLHGQGIVLNELFWGLWLVPFGVLVYKSRFLPRVLGAWLVVNGSAWVFLCLIGLFSQQNYSTMFKLSQPVLFGELAIMMWLLIRGANVKALPVPVS